MRLPISNLNDERLHTVVILERNAASENHCIVGLKSKSAWPELGSLDRGRMDSELLSGGIICRCSFEACNIRSMTKLRLGVASNNVQVVRLRDEVSLLLIRGKIVQRVSEHALVKGER